ncbi:MAG: CHAT domain-containing protein, partial [Bacteroidetes bacterium]|nr:CHAT domain-containing protein [Bacteroidota bacterium]
MSRSLLVLALFVSNVSCFTVPSEPPVSFDNDGSDLSETFYLLEQAELALFDARYDSALVRFSDVAEKFENDGIWDGYVSAVLGIGRTYGMLGEYQLAEHQLQEAISDGKRFLGDRDILVANGLSELGRVYVRLARFDEAKDLLDEGLTVQEELLGESNELVGRTYQALGLWYHFQGDYDRALDEYEKSYAILSQAKGAQSYEATIPLNNIANIAFRRGDYQNAADIHTSNLLIRELRLRSEHPAVAASYGNLGVIYHEMGLYERALSYHQRAAEIWHYIFGNEHPELASSYNNIGYALNALGRYAEATTYLDLAIKQKTKFLGSGHTRTANSYEILGESYHFLGRFEDAESSLLKSIEIWDASNFRKDVRYWTALRGLAKVYVHLGRFDEAIDLLNETWEISSNSPHPFTSKIVNDLSDLEAESGRPEEQIRLAHQAIQANIQSFTLNDPTVNPTVRGVLDNQELLRSLRLKADGWYELYQRHTDKTEYLQLALSSLERGAELIEKMRRDRWSQGSKITLVGEAASLYGQALRISLQLYKRTGRSRYQQIALHFAERRKSGLLLDAIVESEARDFAGITDSLLNNERQLRVQIAYYERQLAEISGSASLDSLKTAKIESKLFEIKRDYEQIIRRFEIQYPEYYALKYDIRTTPISEIRTELLGDSTALLEFVLEKDTLFVFTLTSDTFATTGVSIPENFSQLVDSLRWGITRRHAPTYLSHAYKLYQILLQPVSQIIEDRDLIIIPEGVMNFIPFEALITREVIPDGIFVRYDTLPYVIMDRSVSYAYSATLLYQTRKRRRTEPTMDFFGIAPVFDSDMILDGNARRFLSLNGYDTTRTENPVSFLPGTQDEIQSIQALFDSRTHPIRRLFGSRSRILLKNRATEYALKTNDISRYRYIHFATHSFANDRDAKLSGMLLVPSGTGEDDGILHAGEVYGLRLNADLVVLSACDTGIGQVTSGGGISGFSRGFLYAGAK